MHPHPSKNTEPIMCVAKECFSCRTFGFGDPISFNIVFHTRFTGRVVSLTFWPSGSATASFKAFIVSDCQWYDLETIWRQWHRTLWDAFIWTPCNSIGQVECLIIHAVNCSKSLQSESKRGNLDPVTLPKPRWMVLVKKNLGTKDSRGRKSNGWSEAPIADLFDGLMSQPT